MTHRFVFTIDGCSEDEASQMLASLLGWVAPERPEISVDYRKYERPEAVVMSGNPRDGFNIIGPFDTYDDALRYAENAYPELNADWWIILIEAPVETVELPE